MPLQRVGFLHHFGLKTGKILPFLVSRIGYGLQRNYGCASICSSFQFQMSKKESVICEFEMDLKKYFCCNFNLGNDNIISVLCKQL